MPIPMPTIVAKGILAYKLDRRYSSPERRWVSLRKLQDALDNYAVASSTGVAVGVTGTLAINAADGTHLDTHWFGPKFDPVRAGHPTQLPSDPNNIWAVLSGLTPGTTSATVAGMPDQAAADGELIITAGLVEALKISLGLVDNPSWARGSGAGRYTPMPKFLNVDGKLGTPDEVQEVDPDPAFPPPTTKRRERMLDTSSLRRNLPIDVYWVCGKFDGFEAQISWNSHQVTVFLLTPPVKFPVGGLGAYPNAPVPLKNALERAPKGMVLVRGKTDLAGRVDDHTVELIGMTDGGITPGPA